MARFINSTCVSIKLEHMSRVRVLVTSRHSDKVDFHVFLGDFHTFGAPFEVGIGHSAMKSAPLLKVTVFYNRCLKFGRHLEYSERQLPNMEVSPLARTAPCRCRL